MKTVDFTPLQRLNVEGMIASKAGSLSFEEQILWAEVRKKIKIPTEDRGKIIQGNLIDEAELASYPVLTVDLENEEARSLLKLVKEWTKYADGDTVWSVPLKDSLEAK